MISSINKGQFNLNIILDKEQLGLSHPDLVSKTYSYAKRAVHFSEKTWGNLFARLFDALSHIFCKKVDVRGINPVSGGWENQTFWVKGEVTAKVDAVRHASFGSIDSQDNPKARSKAPSDASSASVGSNPRSPATSVGSSSPTSLEAFEVQVEPLSSLEKIRLEMQKLIAQTRFNAALDHVYKATDMPHGTDLFSADFTAKWRALPDVLRKPLNEALCTARQELKDIQSKLDAATVV
jgi:hypothetical protein